MRYYKRLNKSYANGIVALEKHYEEMKSRIGVIVGNDEDGEFILYPSEMDGEFVVTYVSKNDINNDGFNADSVTDEQMRELANEIEDDVLENSNYWAILEGKCKEWGLESFWER